MASLLKAHRTPGVVDRLEVEARERARELVAAAKEEAARIRSGVERERRDALAAAAAAGGEEGRAAAAALLLGVATARRQRLEGVERELVAAALEVARAVIGRAVADGPELVVELARRALEPVRVRREILVRVNPADAPRLRAHQAQLGSLLERAPTIQLWEDAAVEPGGVLVETEAGSVDASVEAQLAVLERALGEGAA